MRSEPETAEFTGELAVRSDAPQSTTSPTRSNSSSPIQDTPEMQAWTQSGCPIVAGKYLENGVVKEISPDEPTAAGPPVLDIYWHNRYMGPDAFVFRGVACWARGDVTGYLSRLGDFLVPAQGSCRIMALNATLYSVNVIVFTEMTHREMVQLLRQHRLVN